ncbi:MAG TPA: hypothetical protein VMV10_32850 [Pirellulales bacterium]|nr:hypothetical protein [Pirellulales bacterium]
MDAANAAEKELHRQLTKLSDDLLKIVAAMPKHERGLGEPRYASDRALAVLWTKRNDHGINRFLMMNISQFDNSARSGEGLMAGYPCARVLAQLGPTAAYQIVKHLERPPVGSDLSDRAIDTFASVIVTAFPSGNGGIEEAKAMLTRARRRAKNTEHIDRLNKAVREFFEHKPPPPPHPDAP